MTGEYPPSGGWSRLIPEKIEPQETPKRKKIEPQETPKRNYWFSKLFEFSLMSCLVGISFFCATTLFYVLLIENIAATAMRYGAIASVIGATLTLPTLFFLNKRGYL